MELKILVYVTCFCPTHGHGVEDAINCFCLRILYLRVIATRVTPWLNNLDKKQLSAAHRRALSDTMLVSTMNLVFPNQRDFIIKPFFFHE